MKYQGVMLAIALALIIAPFSSQAEIVGINTAAPSLSQDRIEHLSPLERKKWADYIKRSHQQMMFDRNTLARELKKGETPPPPPLAAKKTNIALNAEASWYKTPEAKAIADTIVSFQTPTGGWSKNQDRAGPKRVRGQRYSNDAETMHKGTGNFDEPKDPYWTFVGTLDNGATWSEMRFLAHIQAAYPAKEGNIYRKSILKGINYLLLAQYPNGGWPQIYPLEGGFHDGITFNDEVVSEAADFLFDVAEGKNDFSFVPKSLRQKALEASNRAVNVILDAQVVVNGQKTIWPQQVDALTLEPISARNYEMRSLASSESTSILLYLMRQENPSEKLKTAVHAGVAWLKDRAIYGYAFTKVSDEEGRKLIAKEGAGPLWSRNYDIKTFKPIFGDWDKNIYSDVNEISKGRRNGYSWYNNMPQKAIKAYEAWSLNHPQK